MYNFFRIGIVSVTPSAFCLDGIRLRGKMKIYIRSIESLGIVTIPIHLVNWNNLPDYEKIPYLMNKINTRSPINLSTKEVCTINYFVFNYCLILHSYVKIFNNKLLIKKLHMLIVLSD